jgi:signal transduction histidine kinase
MSKATTGAVVLHCNDDAGARYLGTRILRSHGFVVIEATSGIEAISRAREHRPDVMVLDINLPDVSGYEVCRVLKADPDAVGICVIQTSATFVTSEKKAMGLQSGADAYLTQPYEPIELVAMIHALLRLRAAESEARSRAIALAEADRRKDEFLAMLSHELRNPLSSMTTALALIEQRLPEDEIVHRLIGTLERQARHLGRLVDDLLDVSRITHGKIALHRTPIDLVAHVRSTIEAIRPQFGKTRHDVVLDLPAGEPIVVDVDPTRFEQIIQNLLGNAAKYTAPGGRVTVRVGRGQRAGVPHALLVIRDDGIGVAPEHLAQLFDLFYQVEPPLARSQSGLGLGLTMVKRLVDMHGGRVSATSDGIGKGTEFVVELPIAVGIELPVATSQVVTLDAPRGLRILLVDDNVDSCEIFAMALQQAGHEVETAFDGARGLELLLAGRHDVAVLDIGLPVVDGYELAQRTVEAFGASRPHLIALTGYGRAEDRARALAAGFDQHLVKPVDLHDLELAFGHVRERGARRAQG